MFSNVFFCFPFAPPGGAAANSYDTQGPSFVREPPSRLEFINTLGGRADCAARANPAAAVEWQDQDGNPTSSIPKVFI